METQNEVLIKKSKTVCFSGHRPEKLPDGGNESSPIVRALKSMLYKEIADSVEAGFNTFITGLARGVDLWAGEIVLELKNKYPHIKLVAAAPYRGHGSGFKGWEKFVLGNIMRYADEIVYVSENYSRSCMMERNRYMVDRSEKLIAVVSDYKSGTGQTIRYAQKCGIIIKIFDSGSFEEAVSSCYEQLSL